MSKLAHVLLPSPRHISQVVSEILTRVESETSDAKVWLLEGPLGIGKTTFIQGMCRHFGIKDSVLSPTFTLLREYKDARGKCFYHFDWYRLQRAHDAYDIGVEEYFSSGCYCFVEWGEKTPPALLPPVYVRLRFSLSDAKTRKLALSVVSNGHSESSWAVEDSLDVYDREDVLDI